MTNIKTCDICNGHGYYDALISAHSDVKETIKCEKCCGKGAIYQINEQEEDDYWADYW